MELPLKKVQVGETHVYIRDPKAEKFVTHVMEEIRDLFHSDIYQNIIWLVDVVAESFGKTLDEFVVDDYFVQKSFEIVSIYLQHQLKHHGVSKISGTFIGEFMTFIACMDDNGLTSEVRIKQWYNRYFLKQPLSVEILIDALDDLADNYSFKSIKNKRREDFDFRQFQLFDDEDDDEDDDGHEDDGHGSADDDHDGDGFTDDDDEDDDLDRDGFTDDDDHDRDGLWIFDNFPQKYKNGSNDNSGNKSKSNRKDKSGRNSNSNDNSSKSNKRKSGRSSNSNDSTFIVCCIIA